MLDPALRVPSLSVVSGAINTDWARGLLGDLSPGEDIDGFKPPVMDVNDDEGRCGRELAGVDFAFELELEDVLVVVVNERWISRAVGISDSSRLQTTTGQSPKILKKKRKKKEY